VGQAYGSLFRGHVKLSPVYSLVLIIFVNYISNFKKLAKGPITFGKQA